MKRILSEIKAAFLRDRLYFVTCAFFLLTVVSSFLGSAVLNFTVPAIGEIFPFRVFLPITVLLYLIWALQGNDKPWQDSSAIEKWAYGLICVLIIYGAVSLLWAENFLFSFKKLFNLCFDVAFFFLLLRLCRKKAVLRAVLAVVLIGFLFLSILGVYEVFNGGFFNDTYNNFHRAPWFGKYLQPPVVVAANTNDYCSALVFLAAVFLAGRAFGLFDKSNRIVKYAPVVIFPILFFLITAANSRLNFFAFWILLAITVIHDLLAKFCKKRILALIAVLLCCISFCQQYQTVVLPTYNAMMAKLEAFFDPTDTNPDHSPNNPVIPPNDQDNGSLKNEFFMVDEDGNVVLNDDASGGVRVRLLAHTANCFIDSYGLGVGLGNTEVLAAKRSVIPKWAEKEANSIHCFIARIIADYGIFVLIPLCAIVFLLLRKIWKIFVAGMKAKDIGAIAKALLFLCCCCVFPIVSTAPSDAQDILAMWLYLSIIILLCNRTSGTNLAKEETSDA